MAFIKSATEIATDALMKINEITPNDPAADATSLALAISWLDMALAHHLSTNYFWFLIPDQFTIALTAGDNDYDLLAELGASWPQDGLIFPIEAKLIDDAGNPHGVDIIRRDKWDDLDQTTTGPPDKVYFDRSSKLTLVMRVHPMLATGVTGWSIRLTAQRYGTRLTGGGQNPSVLTDLSAAWNLWATTMLAAELGDGPIRRLDNTTITRWKGEAKQYLDDLKRFAGDQHADDAIAEPWGL